MNGEIVIDSSCDLPFELEDKLGIVSVPFIINFGEKQFMDDRKLDMPTFLDEMKRYEGKISTSMPTPESFKDAFMRSTAKFGITISGNLSGCFGNAMLGKTMAEEEGKSGIHIFDSKSATAGEVLIALKLRKLMDEGVHNTQIIAMIERFIREMKTYFVLENVTNLLKNGRLSLVKGLITTLLHIKPIMGSDGDGNIALFSKVRGRSRVLEKMLNLIEESGKDTFGQTMVITHCNNESFANRLATAVKNRFQFGEILIYSTKGLSSVYADDQGVVMAF